MIHRNSIRKSKRFRFLKKILKKILAFYVLKSKIILYIQMIYIRTAFVYTRRYTFFDLFDQPFSPKIKIFGVSQQMGWYDL